MKPHILPSILESGVAGFLCVHMTHQNAFHNEYSTWCHDLTWTLLRIPIPQSTARSHNPDKLTIGDSMLGRDPYSNQVLLGLCSILTGLQTRK